MVKKVEFVDSQREEYGLQPVLQALHGTPAQIAPSTYYVTKTRPASARQVGDSELIEMIEQVHEVNYGVYGARKVWQAGAVASVGSVGDSYDNAMAEAFNSLFKAELVHNKGPWRDWTTWKSRPSSTSTGTTTPACTASSNTSHPLTTMPYTR